MISISEPHDLPVKCPICTESAELRYVVRTDVGLQVIRFRCPNQAQRGHGTPAHRALVEIVVDAEWGTQPA